MIIYVSKRHTHELICGFCVIFFWLKMVEKPSYYLYRRRVRDGEISVIKGPSDTPFYEEANKLNRESYAPIRYVWHSGTR